ncbi:MAG: MlaD family protein [Deltaproteobacteria bacterium]|nr:MlaD family protein [Deltaproteobacteria bacterium]
MAKQASKTVIGVFVVASIAMLIAGVTIFGSGNIFKKTIKYVMFFEDSVKGLSVGARVIWHGVQIGNVSRIVLRVNTKQVSINIPVIIEVDPRRMEIEGEIAENPFEGMKQLIAKGLRARLALQSIVTGSSEVSLEFLPGTPVRLTGLYPLYPEIPTLRSPIEKLAKKLEDLPIQKIAAKLVDILDHLDSLLKDPQIKELVHNLNEDSKKLNGVLENTDKLVLNADGHVTRVSGDLQSTLEDARKLLKDASQDLEGVSSDARNLLQEVDNRVKPVIQKIETVLNSANKALGGATKTLTTVNGFVGERSGTRLKLNRALDEIAAAATSLKSLMDYLERHPNALLMGKGRPK